MGYLFTLHRISHSGREGGREGDVFYPSNILSRVPWSTPEPVRSESQKDPSSFFYFYFRPQKSMKFFVFYLRIGDWRGFWSFLPLQLINDIYIHERDRESIVKKRRRASFFNKEMVSPVGHHLNHLNRPKPTLFSTPKATFSYLSHLSFIFLSRPYMFENNHFPIFFSIQLTPTFLKAFLC